jgi:SAM-dependent methyltransferase
MSAWREAFRATGEVASYLLLATLWPILHAVSLIRPAPFPPWATPLLEGPLRRRLQSAEQLVEQSGIVPGMTVLEVGPGGGYFTEAAVRRLGPGGCLACLDLQADMLRQVRARLGRKSPLLACGSGSQLPFRDGCFDVVFLVSVLGEIPDREGALREYRRTLRPGGILAVSEAFPDPDYVREPVLRDMAVRCGFDIGEEFSSFPFPAYTQQLRRPYVSR